LTPPRLPPPVLPGSRVGVAALSGPVDPRRLERGVAELEALGFEPVLGSNLASRSDLFAGDDDERLTSLHELADDASLDAIFLARGGHGLLRLLPRIDWPRLAARPRAWIGYSDATPLLNLLVERCGLVAFHGPMVASDLARGLDREERESLLSALAGAFPLVYDVESIEDSTKLDGPVEGRLAGGCLSLLVSCLGTPFQHSLADTILVLEDVDEPSYRIDRMLTHLALSGSLTGVRGIALGDLRGRDEPTLGVAAVAERVRAAAPGIPIVRGLTIGHRAPNRTLPLGATARLDPSSQSLIVQAVGRES